MDDMTTTTTTVLPTHQPEHRPDASRGVVRDDGCGECAINMLKVIGGMISCVLFVALAVYSACFFISGVVFCAEEYEEIPDCAKSYRGWSIAMTAIYGVSALQSKKFKDLFTLDLSESPGAGLIFGVCLWIFAVLPGLAAGLGSRDVLHHPAETCDTSGIPQLKVWTEWIIITNWCIMGILLLAGLVCCVFFR